jgi:hypothetical protein
MKLTPGTSRNYRHLRPACLHQEINLVDAIMVVEEREKLLSGDLDLTQIGFQAILKIVPIGILPACNRSF